MGNGSILKYFDITCTCRLASQLIKHFSRGRASRLSRLAMLAMFAAVAAGNIARKHRGYDRHLFGGVIYALLFAQIAPSSNMG